jgi:hypothetical protein
MHSTWNGLRAGLALAAATALIPLQNASAALIEGFDIAEGPTLEIGSLLLAYDEADDGLFILDLDSNGTLDTGDEGVFGIDGTGFRVILGIDGTGRLQSGTLELDGVVDELGFDSGNLLAGEAVDFGFAEDTDGAGPLTDELQIVFEITGGDAGSLFGNRLAVRLTGTGFNGGWSSDWVNDGDGSTVAGTAVVPLPGALALLLSGLAGVGVLRRRIR